MDTYNTPYNVINLKLETPTKKTFSEKRTLQQIFYGAPGTGKSDGVKKLTEAGGMFHKDYIYRTTFHPDSDYSTFVGAYKPVWDDIKGKIVYEFRPQTFLKAYIAAWTHPDKNVALVIEEINRGNCAQIFGDVFQLLDRENDGLSKYPIESDVDMQGFIKKAFSGEIEADWAGTIEENDGNVINDYYSKHYDGAFEKIKNGEILALPKNLSILATMNTSDQSLFPMDSAFKRRWEWIYKPIVNAGLNWKIKLDDKYEPIDWWEFLDRINKVISGLTTSKDKKLGYFFCCPDEKKSDDDSELSAISAKLFVGKVIFYLWNDVFKDYAFDADCCKDEKGEEVMYSDFYKKDRTEINIDVLKRFFDELKEENEDSLVIEKKKEDVPSEDDDDSIEE
ncbi:MAG: AAA family ATPase [Bacteroidaceae bacterium]|nr:AAA family ATPase [Bacteroidaceae bacterium]